MLRVTSLAGFMFHYQNFREVTAIVFFGFQCDKPIILFFFCWAYAELLCSYNTQKNTQMEKITSNGACMQDLPPAYEDIYRM